ncbi:MAG: outer membrane protein assembly factor BamA, partial [Acetobacteraceae bacterium]|nr:outer membrane protein assembly factor BamA [Acetobacteraceae bacterium]
MNRSRAALLATACLFPALAQPSAFAQGAAPAGRNRPPARAHAASAATQPSLGQGTIQNVRIEGNERIEAGTIRSYMLVGPGDPFDPDRLDRSLKTLYATGLFQDVNLSRQGNTLVVKVVENPIVNRIAFEGNHKLTDENLRTELQLRPRAVFTPELARADRQRILDAYAKKGRFDARVEPKIIRLDQNRVDVVFEINEGESTLLSRIAFVGNRAFSEDQLREVINSREGRWWRFLSSSDNYDPERVNFDKELLRRFYLKNGYADFEVTDASAELAPDRSAFFLTFTLNEGERYTVGKITVNSQLPKLKGDELLPDVQLETGDWYDGDAVERSVQTITDDVQNRGYAFVEVKPRISRDKAKHTVDLVFDVGEGPRVYVERIDIQGNTRTEDKVIRREFRLAEGDAFNAAAIRRTRQRLQDLGYFSSVTINPSPGSAPDRAILTTNVEEKATGELTLGGGYSTDAGFLISAGIRERNLLGTGVDASLSGVLAQRNSSIDLSMTDPYFLDRNLVAGFDLFFVTTNNQDISQYSERRAGAALRLGYEFNEHLRQSWNYTVVDRDVFDVATNASFYIRDQAGWSLLSQIGQTLSLDYRDSTVDPHTGFITRLGTDFAGIGGDAKFVRTKIDGTYYLPLDRFTGNSDWGFAISAGAGYFFDLGNQEKIIDRFFLGGDNLRGFQAGGAGPHDEFTGDSLGGRLIWTQSTELRFPLPISADIGLSGRTFVDVGALTNASFESGTCNNAFPLLPPPTRNSCPPISDIATPRVGAGVGVAWRTPFG